MSVCASARVWEEKASRFTVVVSIPASMMAVSLKMTCWTSHSFLLHIQDVCVTVSISLKPSSHFGFSGGVADGARETCLEYRTAHEGTPFGSTE